MNHQEYLKDLVSKYNANPSDPTITDNERLFLSKIQEAEKKVAGFMQQIEGIEKEINQRTQQLVELRGQILKERGRSDAFVESILSLRG